jgi:hypothetical protein
MLLLLLAAALLLLFAVSPSSSCSDAHKVAVLLSIMLNCSQLWQKTTLNLSSSHLSSSCRLVSCHTADSTRFMLYAQLRINMYSY